jgi:hypothetical protein
MNRLQRAAVALAIVVLGAVILSSRSHASLAQMQRDQISIAVLVNVTPAAGYVPPPQAPPVIAKLALREARGSDQNVDAIVSPGGDLVAQASQQKPIKVMAQVTPNPNATLLYGNLPMVQMTGTAGTTIQQTCIYTVTVHTTITTWTLREGLSGDFSGSFPGTDLANNSYIQGATPQPTSTPFIVYPTSWSVLAQNGGIKTYCVDLSLTIPAAVPGGTYSTNAVYTLYY